MTSFGRREDEMVSAPFKAFILTGGVKHDERRRMLLQEAVKRLIGQVEDRGAGL